MRVALKDFRPRAAMRVGCPVLIAVTLLIRCGHSVQYELAKGDRFFADGKFADAEIQYRKAIQKDPQLGTAYHKLGLALIKEDKGSAAYQALESAVALLPKDVESRIALADVAFAFYSTETRKSKTLHDEVARIASQILDIEPKSPDGFRLKGEMELIDGRADDAVKSYRKANELRPGDRDIILGYVQSLFRTGGAREGEDLALAFLGKDSQFAPLYDVLYGAYMSLGRTAEAEQILNRWIDKNPRDYAAVVRLAGHFEKLQKPALVAATLERMVDRPGNYPAGPMYAGDFYAGVGEWPEAVA